MEKMEQIRQRNIIWEASVHGRGQGGEKHTIPERIPPDPKPAIALPRMNAIEFGAAPQRAEPPSKSTMEVIKTALMLKTVYTFPNNS